jgi:hypothetical protein
MTKLAQKSSQGKFPIVRLDREDHERLRHLAYELDTSIKALVTAAIEHFYRCPNGIAVLRQQ